MSGDFQLHKGRGIESSAWKHSPKCSTHWLDSVLKFSLLRIKVKNSLFILSWLWSILHITAQTLEHFHLYFNQSIRNVFFNFWFIHLSLCERRGMGTIKYTDNSDEKKTLLNEIAKWFTYLNYWCDCLNFPFSLPDRQTREPMIFICFWTL